MSIDFELMARVKAGDTRAFNLVIERYQAPLVNFLTRLTGNRQVAEELAQETFLRVYLAAGRYRPTAKFTTYLYRIARNLALNTLRRKKLVRFFNEFSDLFVQRLVEGRGSIAPESDDRAVQRVRDALQLLPESQRTALVLCKYDELSYEEIAGVMGLSVSAVKSVIFRAKEAMKEKLKEQVAQLLVS